MVISYAPMLDFAGSILHIAALLGDRPRSIDQYIDYFGDGTESAGRCEPDRPWQRAWPSERARRCRLVGFRGVLRRLLRSPCRRFDRA
jgi:hypothetical protein